MALPYYRTSFPHLSSCKGSQNWRVFTFSDLFKGFFHCPCSFIIAFNKGHRSLPCSLHIPQTQTTCIHKHTCTHTHKSQTSCEMLPRTPAGQPRLPGLQSGRKMGPWMPTTIHQLHQNDAGEGHLQQLGGISAGLRMHGQALGG